MKLTTIEKILVITVATLMILKLSNIYSSIWLITFASLLLSILYIVFTLGFLNNNTLQEPFKMVNKPKLQQPISIGFGVSFSAIAMGFMWDLISLPSSEVLLFLGVFISLTLSVMLIFTKQNYELLFKKAVLVRVIAALTIALFILAKPDHFYLKVQHRNHPEFIEAVIKAQENPQDTLLWENVRRLEQEMKK